MSSTPRASALTSTSSSSTTSNEPRSLNRQVILDEDDYTAALSQIIARDFFPSLVHLDATNDYLDALNSNDPNLITASVRRVEQLNDNGTTPGPSTRNRSTRNRPWQTPSETPYAAGASETPLRTPRTEVGDMDVDGPDGRPSKRARYDTDLSLDAFQSRYTSEDNSSFTHILHEENKRRKEKYGWAWEAQKKVEAMRERMIEGRERALLEGPKQGEVIGVREKLKIEAPVPRGLITASGEGGPSGEGGEENEGGEKKDGEGDGDDKGKQVVLKASEEEGGVVDVMAPKKDKRSAGVDGWSFKARNNFMFSPDADISPYDPASSAWRDNKLQPDPKFIKHGNTRMPEHEQSSSSTGGRGASEPPSPTRSRIDAAIAGTPYRPKSPGVNSFSYVPSLPSPTPSQLGPAAVKQLMTLGTLTGTPRILSQPTDLADMIEPPTPFRINEPSARETLSHKLSSTAAKSLRAKANLLNRKSGGGGRGGGLGGKGDMAPPSWTPRRAEVQGNLTPAAKRLLDRTTMGSAAARRAEAMSRMAGWEGSGSDRRSGKEKDLNRVRWTPTPSPVTRK